jgi:hypothetical protein
MKLCKFEPCPKSVSGRQKYCSDRCRQKARKGVRALRYRRGQNPQISVFHPLELLREFQPSSLWKDIVALETNWPKPVPASAYKHLELKQVNSCTWKVTDGTKTNVPASHGNWAGYQVTKALAWVIDLGNGQWVARCGNEICNPTNLAQAKRQALAMAVGGVGDYQVANAIKECNRLAAIIEECS